MKKKYYLVRVITYPTEILDKGVTRHFVINCEPEKFLETLKGKLTPYLPDREGARLYFDITNVFIL